MNSFLIRILCAVVGLSGLVGSPLRGAVVGTIEQTDFGPVNGFELFGKGLYWWNSGYGGDEITPPRRGQIATLNLLSDGGIYRVSSPSVFLLRSNTIRAPYQSVARNAEWLFHFEDAGAGLRIMRRPISNPTASAIDFSGLPSSQAGAMLVHGNTLFWSVVQGNVTQVHSKNVNGGPGGGNVIEFSLNNVGPIVKMGVVDLMDPEGRGVFETDLLVLTAGGLLYKFEIEPYHEGLALLASNVSDFAARIESWLVPVGLFGFERRYGSKVYFTTGVNLSGSRTEGRLISVDLSNGGTAIEFQTGDVNLQLTGVTTDSARVYITRTPLVFQGGGGFGGYVYDRNNGQILRSSYPANRGQLAGGSFQSIVLQQEGRNLRSDGQWLYWAHQDLIQRSKTETPAVQLDYRAIGIEAGQAVQNAGNSLWVVSGAPVSARVYAQQLINTSGRILWPVKARVRAFRNNQPLSPPEAYSWNRPLLPSTGNLATLRATAASSLQVDLPGEWFAQPGDVQLIATINPTLSVPETGETPLANNTVSTTITVVSSGTPCLVFNVMNSTLPNYNPTAPGSGFASILDRALSLLPVPGFTYWIRAGTINNGSAGGTFLVSTNSGLALTALSAAHALEKNPNGCPDTHWVGMFPAGVTNFNGVGDTPGTDLLIRMGLSQGNAALPWTSIRGGFALAHELAHNYGLRHIDQTLSPQNCSTDKPGGILDPYFFDPCTLGPTNLAQPLSPMGYDLLSNVYLLPTEAGDLMSYADTRWTSAQTWSRLLFGIPGPAPALLAKSLAAAPPAPGGPVLFVQGFIDLAANSGTLLPAIHGEAGVFDEARVQQSFTAAAALLDAPLRMQLLNANGTVLVDCAALTIQLSEMAESQRRLQQFIPFDPAAIRLRLIHGNVVLSEITASANPPVLTLNAPALDLVNGVLSLDWAASDADGNAVLFTTQFSPDDGVSWQTLRVREADFGMSVGTALLPGGDACRLRVLATDGFNTVVAMTDPFVLPRKGPVIHYAGVRDGQRFAFGETIEVRAVAYDAEDGGLPPAAVSWSVSGKEVRSGTGGQFPLRGLAPGTYTMAFSATDAQANESMASLEFEVLPLVVLDGPAPVLDGFSTDAGYAEATPVSLRTTSPEPSARLVHANGFLHVSIEGNPLSDAGVSPSSVRIFIDADGSRDNAPQSGDRGFAVTEDGVISQARGDGTNFLNEVTTSPGFSAQIARSETTWGIEMQIPESLLGGWNHGAGIAFVFQRFACVPFGFGCLDVPENPVPWPANASVVDPATWTSAQFGALPTSENRAPVALAAGPGVVSLTQSRTITLDGSGSYDLDGDALTFAWTQIDGPPVVLQDSGSPMALFEAPMPGVSTTLRFQLVVNDGNFDSAAATVSVTLAPTATQPFASKTAGAGTVTLTGDGASILLCWPGGAGDVAVIQASTDLITWETLGTNTANYLSAIVFTDLAANNYPHRFYRAVPWVPDQTPIAGTALAFDGVDDRADVPHDPALNAFPLTLMAWISTTQSAGAYPSIVSKYLGGTGAGYALALDNGRLTAWYYADSANYLWDANDGIDGRFVANGQWHHVAYVVDDVSGRIYINGTLVNTHVWVGSAAAVAAAEPLRLGTYIGGAGLPWAGQLDDVSIWSRALTGEEIRALRHHPLTGLEVGLVAYWNFNEGMGMTLGDGTSSGHDGTLWNDPAWVGSGAPITP